MKAILTHKAESIYDDLPWERYHFPRTYLRQIEQAVGDLIVYYEPRRRGVDDLAYQGRQAYFAVARVTAVRPDPSRSDHFYADIADYLEFEQPVPFQTSGHYLESGLRKEDGTTNRGFFGRAVRALPAPEFDAIIRAGFAAEWREAVLPSPSAPGLHEPPPAGFVFDHGQDHTIRPAADRVLTSRLFRDRAFADIVGRAYDRTCAFTGLKLVNGGGRAEAEAAHIRPVAHNGPDTVRNGLALSGTVHWMFDRGLISIAPDDTILTAGSLPDQVERLFNRDRKVRLPRQPWLRPAPVFLDYHRQQVFKG